MWPLVATAARAAAPTLIRGAGQVSAAYAINKVRDRQQENQQQRQQEPQPEQAPTGGSFRTNLMLSAHQFASGYNSVRGAY